jgi:putative ABC transport system ATP-binding protein
MLSLRSVGKQFTRRDGSVQALVDATLDVPAGDFVAIVGASGSGKSTLLHVAGGMLSPTSGKVLVEGRSLYDLGVEDRAWVRRLTFGFVFQTFNLIPYLTALENVQVPLFLSGLSPREQARKASALLDRLGLADRQDHKPFELSIGQQQRVALARMLANDPKIILADEPTANLDPENAGSILRFFQEMNGEGRTVLMVTHNPEASRIAKRVLRLENGRIIPG